MEHPRPDTETEQEDKVSMVLPVPNLEWLPQLHRPGEHYVRESAVVAPL